MLGLLQRINLFIESTFTELVHPLGLLPPFTWVKSFSKHTNPTDIFEEHHQKKSKSKNRCSNTGTDDMG